MFDKKKNDELPKYIGNFRILARLGKGGMGDIYKAVQESLDRIVALKVLPPHFGRDDEFAKRFRTEAEAISRLQHQNIVTVYESGEKDGYSYFAMQFVDGIDLSRYIAERKEVPIADTINFAKQICRGLRFAHNNNVVHRDIKPQNTFIDKNGIVKLGDFGIAKILSKASDLTMTGFTLGTPEYMSPEQALGKDVDHRTDIYSLGILMYEMLTGKPPFTANDPMAVAYKQVHEQPPLPSCKRRDVPKRLELIILKALKKNKDERYGSVGEMLDHLDSVDPDERVDSTTASMPSVTSADTAPALSATAERRIVDRRSWGDSGGFSWMGMVRTQWPSWILIAILGAAFIYHLFRFHL